MARDVPVRYMLANESVEQDAKFVKIAKDTVYLLPLDSAEIAEIQKKDEALLKQLEPDSVEEENQTGDMESDQNLNPLEAAEDSAMVADSLARVDSLARADSLAKAQADSAKIAAASDFEAALLAQEKQAMEDSLAKEKAMADSIAAVSDSIRAVERQDSLDKIAAIPIEQKYIKIFKYELMRMTNLESGEAVNLSLSDFVFPELDDEEEPIYPEGNANLRVTSYPDSCEIYINGESLELFAPDTIRKIKPGKYTVSVRKMLKGVDWWGSKTIKINADSLNVVHIEVERPTTKLTVATIPDGVEVYVDEQPNESILPEYLTDVAIETEPSVQKIIYLRKVGYLDTALAVEVKAFMPNPVYVELEAVDNASVVEMQREYDRERAKRRIGRGLLWSSIAPIIAGGVFWYLAERDWSDAADKKSAYNKSAFESPDTQKLLKKNKDLNDSGDTKGLIGLGFGVVGVGLFVTGFVLAF
ncbi:hypothetical protein [Fibrobacter sp. UWS1]|uniref:hypothetical protein n=1 Tax=Fibrobacter sp. UWS1 TaxID=1896220 RepID=UPI000BC45DD0|nr:hypothetical protein [Fibrobacter sp. UWS1]PBC68747.1 hypothetical protein BGX14_1129 [Fibrobacter sp. UWS1]